MSKFDLIIFIAEFKMAAKSEMATILIKENRHFETKQLVAWELQNEESFSFTGSIKIAILIS
jgi:hypothetical protein